LNTALDNNAKTVQQSYVKHTENLQDENFRSGQLHRIPEFFSRERKATKNLSE
jgi:hypothetical protein